MQRSYNKEATSWSDIAAAYHEQALTVAIVSPLSGAVIAKSILDKKNLMAQVLCVVVAFWAASVNGFLPNSARSLSHKRFSYLSAGFNVGDTIIAEVDDILGTVSDPKVSFLVRIN